MKKYIGTKTVSAAPAWRIDGEVHLKSEIQINALGIGKSYAQSKAEDGYKVVYEDGYESWSPKDVFEKAYKIAETPVDCMRIEDKELSTRISELMKFLTTDKFKELDAQTRAMLYVQLEHMKVYSTMLLIRGMRMESAPISITHVPFSVAVALLKNGFPVRRNEWNKNLWVIKQVPAHISEKIIPKMQSLPQSAKDLVLKSNGFIDYTSQCFIYNENTGRADSWAPSIADIFAKDWKIVI